jgi:hypothetical protein
MWLGIGSLTFRREILPPSSELKHKESRKMNSVLCFFFLFRYLRVITSVLKMDAVRSSETSMKYRDTVNWKH